MLRLLATIAILAVLVGGCECGRKTRAGKGDTYTVIVHCRNCDWEGKVEVPKGKTVSAVVCPNCRLWDAEPGRETYSGGIAEDGISHLRTRDNWRLLMEAAGGRRR